ncbi:MAG: hypothetical protein LBL30_00195 [Holosporales bacterium]|jgi:hypothetical protein|nr:hypothetical protein [Holosporales bacterium]
MKKTFAKVLTYKNDLIALLLLAGILAVSILVGSWSINALLDKQAQIASMQEGLNKLDDDLDYVNKWREEAKDVSNDFFRRSWCRFDEADIEKALSEIALSCGVKELSLQSMNLREADGLFTSYQIAINAAINSQNNVYKFIACLNNCVPGLVSLDSVDVTFEKSIKTFVCKITFSTICFGLIDQEFIPDLNDIPNYNLSIFGAGVLKESDFLKLQSVIVTPESAKACINGKWYAQGDTIDLPNENVYEGFTAVQILEINSDGITIKFSGAPECEQIKPGQIIRPKAIKNEEL